MCARVGCAQSVLGFGRNANFPEAWRDVISPLVAPCKRLVLRAVQGTGCFPAPVVGSPMALAASAGCGALVLAIFLITAAFGNRILEVAGLKADDPLDAV